MTAVSEAAKAPVRRGRPTVMTPEMQERVLELIGSGTPNTEACADIGVDPATLYYTIRKDPEFYHRYDTAKKSAVDALVDRARAQAMAATRATNGAQVQGHKLMWDHEWREAQRLAPQRWGEKSMVELSGRVEGGDPAEITKRLHFIEMMGEAQTTGEDDDTGGV